MAQDFLLQGDSIEVSAPEEGRQELKAMGKARGESLAGDSLNTEETPSLIRRDWLEGDTILAFFSRPGARVDSVLEGGPDIPPPPGGGRGGEGTAQADSSTYRLERLVAQGGARSLYRMPASDSTLAEERDRKDRLAVHYVLGDEITIIMEEGEVDRMEVVGQTRGIHLEPVRPAGRGGMAEPDTARASGAPGGGRP
jgi:hypothetical protein